MLNKPKNIIIKPKLKNDWEAFFEEAHKPPYEWDISKLKKLAQKIKYNEGLEKMFEDIKRIKEKYETGQPKKIELIDEKVFFNHYTTMKEQIITLLIVVQELINNQ